MNRVFKIYQTLEQRYNHDEIETNGPFPCSHNQSWAYTGYYFWEHELDLGKFWGEQAYKAKDTDYVVCESEYELDEDRCYNFEGNPHQRDEFFQSVEALIESGAIKPNDSLHLVLKYMIHNKLMTHEAFRFIGNPTMARSSMFYDSILIKQRKGQDVLLERIKEVQIVFFEKFGCNRNGFEIVYESNLEVA